MKQKIVAADIASALVPLEPEMFLYVALAGLSARAGLLPIAQDECEGFCVPGLPWDHPMSRGLYALQREMRSLQADSAQVLGAVFRFTALCSPVAQHDLLAEFVDHDGEGNVVALTEFLLRAAATAKVTLGDDKMCYFDPTELADEATRYRKLKLAAADSAASAAPAFT